MNETAGKTPSALDEAAILARFAPDGADAAGLIAYALHRRALLAFRAEFASRQGRAPGPDEENTFLIGEVSEGRIAAYRASARAMIGAGAETTASAPAMPPVKPKRKARWPWFGVWVDAPMAPSGEPETINWRGLLFRLLTLLAAVVTTAILLRVLVVKS